MLLRIRDKALEVAPVDPEALLLACHARIRAFTATSEKLATLRSAPAAHVIEAATAVARYFAVALPLHEADEEQSVAPRLRGDPRPEIGDALDGMTAEHVRLHAVLFELAPIWKRLADPREDPSGVSRSALLEGSRQLRGAFEVHLGTEERVIFPALGALAPGDRQALLAEMRARRQARM